VNFRLFLALTAAAAIFCGSGRDAVADPATGAAMTNSEDAIPKQWLDKEISVAQAEADHMVDGVAFGAQNDRWKKLKAAMLPDDRLWTYCSPFESFQAHAGRCGIAVVRNGRVVIEMVTMMN
jgi:hypothetical protein